MKKNVLPDKVKRFMQNLGIISHNYLYFRF